MRIQPQMKSQLQFSISIVEDNIPESGRIQPRAKTQLQFLVIQFFWKQDFTVRKREGTTLGPLVSSVDCFETNVNVMPQLTDDAFLHRKQFVQ